MSKNTEQFKPTLGIDAPEDSKINFPCIGSLKRDGIRAIIHPELGFVSRSLKPIKNLQLQQKFSELIKLSKEKYIIFDGELYHQDFTFQQITKLVMTDDFNKKGKYERILKDATKEITHEWTIKDRETTKIILDLYKNNKLDNPLEYHIFDCVIDDFDKEYKHRRYNAEFLRNEENIEVVNTYMLNNINDLKILYKSAIDSGYEGLVTRNPKGIYKFGRSTQKEQLLLKYKPQKTYDAIIIDVTERMINTNEPFKNELGRSVRKNTKDNKQGTGMIASYVVQMDGLEFKVTATGTHSERRALWTRKYELIGKMIEFKGLDVGVKDCPRHPVFIRFREDRD